MLKFLFLCDETELRVVEANAHHVWIYLIWSLLQLASSDLLIQSHACTRHTYWDHFNTFLCIFLGKEFIGENFLPRIRFLYLRDCNYSFHRSSLNEIIVTTLFLEELVKMMLAIQYAF